MKCPKCNFTVKKITTDKGSEIMVDAQYTGLWIANEKGDHVHHLRNGYVTHLCRLNGPKGRRGICQELFSKERG